MDVGTGVCISVCIVWTGVGGFVTGAEYAGTVVCVTIGVLSGSGVPISIATGDLIRGLTF